MTERRDPGVLPARRTTAVVTGPPDDVLYESVHALRRLGARITRYDVGAGTLEARTSQWGVETMIRLAATAEPDAGTRLVIESAAASQRRLVHAGFTALAIRRFRAELARAVPPP